VSRSHLLTGPYDGLVINDVCFQRYVDDDDLRDRVNEVVLRAAYERLTSS
jgi:hypothetical protein